MWYVKEIIEYGMFYLLYKGLELIGYSDSNWAGRYNDRKNITGFVFYFIVLIHCHLYLQVWSRDQHECLLPIQMKIERV